MRDGYLYTGRSAGQAAFLFEPEENHIMAKLLDLKKRLQLRDKGLLRRLFAEHGPLGIFRRTTFQPAGSSRQRHAGRQTVASPHVAPKIATP